MAKQKEKPASGRTMAEQLSGDSGDGGRWPGHPDSKLAPKNGAQAREEKRAIAFEEKLKPRDLAVSEALRKAAADEAESFMAEFAKAEPTLDLAREMEGSLSGHVINLARKACTLGRIEHSRTLWFDKLASMAEVTILEKTNPPTKDATGQLYTNAVRLRLTKAGNLWSVYKSTIRQGIRGGLDFMAKYAEGDTDIPLGRKVGDFRFLTFYEVRNELTKIRNEKQRAAQGAPGDAETDGRGDTSEAGASVRMAGGMFRFELVKAAAARLSNEISAAAWPADVSPDVVNKVAQALNACTSALSKILAEVTGDKGEALTRKDVEEQVEADLPDADEQPQKTVAQ